MKTIISLSVCIFIGFSSGFTQSKPKESNRIEIPQVYGVVTTVDQEDSPVDFKQVQLFTDSTGRFPQLRYQVRNKTAKAIVYLSVEFFQRSAVKSWRRHSDGWIENSGEENNGKVLIAPSGFFENTPKVDGDRMLTTREALALFDDGTGKVGAFTFWVGFIKQVKFADGTEYTTSIDGKSLGELLL